MEMMTKTLRQKLNSKLQFRFIGIFIKQFI